MKRNDVDEEASPPKTAVVFFGDSAILQPGEKANYFTKVMRVIEQIDR